ncbi:MAG: tRNA (N6-isopentenyl adenosine(37)-C2)-methylthiotransferase MiaB [Acidobacteria bacterium]|nr:MAG: tRNA (N6-isopentenyl adenosine(37)-C2)-methylthiotransferase MiaB [Acidobacteriota bacterium]
MSRYYIETWGCQMNVHDSEKLAGTLDSLGFTKASREEEADLLLLNTCAVREQAAEKVFSKLGRLGRLKQSRPEILIGVTGCVASMEGEKIFRRAPHVDFVLGPRGLMNLPLLLQAARARRRAIDIVHHQESVLYPWQRIERGEGPPHAYLTVIEGCNKGCTFCIVPRTRGREASRRLEDVIREVRSLAENGYTEVEFLGQTVNAYRDPQGRALSDLLRAADSVEGIRRIRFTTSHPLHMTRGLMRAMAELPRVVRRLHLPVQSGSDAVLARMRRGYTRRGYLDRVRDLRSFVPDISFSTDIIVGFPGETQEDFRKTLELLEEVRFDTVYSFLYSPRPGTPAAECPDDGVSLEEKAERLERLQLRQAEIQIEGNRAWIGREVEVLVEGTAKLGGGCVTGRTIHGQIVNFPSGECRRGDLARVLIEHAAAHSLKGRFLHIGGPSARLGLAG